MVTTPGPQNIEFNPVGLHTHNSKRLPGNQPLNGMDPSAFAATFDINLMQNYLQSVNPSYYSNSVLNSMTDNDMLYAIRMYLYSGDV